MFSAIYIEKEITDSAQARRIMQQFPKLPHIICNNYREIFNRNNQNFRWQKRQPALILAKKFGKLVLPSPENYAIGGKHNYYFSHMLNCIYDCRYCFLQGMYRSANNVLFVNYDEIHTAIKQTIDQHPGEPVYFFSGYDCDSLALEPISGFIDNILPLFEQHPQAWLELRTKSTQIRNLLARPPIPNCIVAFSLSPTDIITQYEHKTPQLNKRLDALAKLQAQGWPIGLRFDPIIYSDQYQSQYETFFEHVFTRLDAQNIHSVSLGNFRLPTDFFKKLNHLYPDHPLFSPTFETTGEGNKKIVSYAYELASPLLAFCEAQILRHIPHSCYYPCYKEVMLDE